MSKINKTITAENLLHDPLLNKGTAFTQKERDLFGLNGLLPPRILPIEEQKKRILKNFNSKLNDIEKYIYLMGLHDRNETLFYNTIIDEIEEMMPIIYTPTVGEACEKFGYLYRRPRGLYIFYKDIGKIKNILQNWQKKSVDIIVVTDGERILGLGDLGTNGMGIPIGKLSLYTTCAGIDPSKTLPIMLDLGTDNSDLLNDPNYLGVKHTLIREDDYDKFIDEFMDAVSYVFPATLIQFEDFANQNASRLLKKYQDKYRMMNDDIQGTASICVAGIGIGELYAKAVSRTGIPIENARQQCWYINSKGLVVNGREYVSDDKKPFAHDFRQMSNLIEIINEIKPTALIGVSGQGKAFTEENIKALSNIQERPVIFALSNPTSKSECTAEQAYNWTEGKCVFASGSPFNSVNYNGKTHIPGQGNNAYVFPGVGLGVIASKVNHVTDEMFLIASKVISNSLSKDDLNQGRVFPPVTEIRELSLEIATQTTKSVTDKITKDLIKNTMYEAIYKDYC